MTPNAHIANMPAFPFGKDEHPGMSYREYLVAQIASNVLPVSDAMRQDGIPPEIATRTLAGACVRMADSIIAELAKDK